MSSPDPRVDALVDRLIECWDWGKDGKRDLQSLTTDISRAPNLFPFTNAERTVVEQFTDLTVSGWKQLPSALAGRAEKVERARIKGLERARAARIAREAEAYRARQEQQAREAEDRRLRREQAARQLELGAFRARLWDTFDSEFLTADEMYEHDPDHELLSHADYEALKADFVQRWAERELDLELDGEQAAAIAAIGGDVLVVARAGSGKTRVLVTRAHFLIKHCQVEPRSLLLLAFNRDASDEMARRLRATLSDDLPHVMTFHQLAYALVRPEETMLSKDGAVQQVVQGIIDDLLREEEAGRQVREFMFQHFREDWDQLLRDDVVDSHQGLARLATVRHESLKGDWVKSDGERLIANTLFEHGVDYVYEKFFRWDSGTYRPDFTIQKTEGGGGVVIEYLGLEGDPEYDTLTEDKRAFWKGKDEWILLEVTRADVASGAVAAQLLGELDSAGVPHARRSEEEIWQLVRRRAIDRFTVAMAQFIGRCRKRRLNEEELRRLIEQHQPLTVAEGMFLQVAASVHQAYSAKLTDAEREDWDGLMWRAVACVQSGQTSFTRDRGRELVDLARLRYVLIDEFQDFSFMFSELIQAIRQASTGVELFCVGDDWQAINGFAGSDLGYFYQFDRASQRARTVEVRTNYRSGTAIVQVGNQLMSGRGSAARASQRHRGNVWLGAIGPTELVQAVSRLVYHFVAGDRDVVLLSRTKSPWWHVQGDDGSQGAGSDLERFLAMIRKRIPAAYRERVTASTTHSYKGRETTAVVVLDCLDARYPLIHPTWMFLRALGETVERLEAEERRLFYVALTRATHSLVILTEESDDRDSRVSPYLRDIRHLLTSVRWAELIQLPPPLGSVEVRVFKAFDVKEHLKRVGYRFDSVDKSWYLNVPVERFKLEELLAAPWRRGYVCIEVRDENGDPVYLD